MRWKLAKTLFLTCLAWVAVCAGQDDQLRPALDPAKTQAAQQRAIQFLAREVPQWMTDNKCFSCHNNGDGARALFMAKRHGKTVPSDSTANTLKWLVTPDVWHTNGPDEPFNDRKVARIQFFHALGEASRAGFVPHRSALIAAGKLVLQDQTTSGAWDFQGADEIGSPVTYGRYLATAAATRTLKHVKEESFAARIALAEQWLRAAEPKSVLDNAAVCWGLGDDQDAAAVAQRQKCLALLRTAQSRDGGFGPYVNAASEPFDTAVVLYALSEANDLESRKSARRAREYLYQTQLSDGSWPETTRPALRESYAQRISTTAWALSALLQFGVR